MNAAVLITGCLLLTGLTATAQNLTTGLIGYFPFNGSVSDATANMSLGTATNLQFGPDAQNQAGAALLTTSTTYVPLEPNGFLNFGTAGSFSFSVAFRTQSGAFSHFFSNQGYASADAYSFSKGWRFGINNFVNEHAGRVEPQLLGNTRVNNRLGIATQATYNDGLWHTATVVVDRSSATRTAQIYIDGVAQPLVNDPSGTPVNGTTYTFTAGADLSPGNGYFSTTAYNGLASGVAGGLDEARFYNRALTAAEAQLLHGLVMKTVSQRESEALVQVYPVPSTGRVTVRLAAPGQAGQLRLYDQAGRLIGPGQVQGQQWEFGNLKAGLYHLRAALPQGEVVRRVLVR